MTSAIAVREQTRPAWSTRLTGIDGLRGFAALAVLVYHVRSLTAASTKPVESLKLISFLDQGLTLFFVLSGFLLFRPFAAALLDGTALPRTGRYLTNRFLRVAPGYLFVLLMTSLVLRIAWLPREVNNAARSFGTLGPGDTILNAFLLQGFFPRSIRSGLEVAWTLGVEVSFYLLLPLVAFLAAKLVLRRLGPIIASVLPALALLVTGVAGKLWLDSVQSGLPFDEANNLEWGANWHAVVARSILVHADLFAYGMLAAVAFTLMASGRLALYRVNRLRAPVALLGLGAIVFAHLPVAGQFDSTFVAIACAALILLVVTPTADLRPSLLGRLFSAPWLRWLGTISFGVYLWHLPVLRWLHQHGLLFPDSVIGLPANLALIAILSTGLAAVTYYLIESQALKFKRRLTTRRVPAH